jgi:hypothetical protein
MSTNTHYVYSDTSDTSDTRDDTRDNTRDNTRNNLWQNILLNKGTLKHWKYLYKKLTPSEIMRHNIPRVIKITKKELKYSIQKYFDYIYTHKYQDNTC